MNLWTSELFSTHDLLFLVFGFVLCAMVIHWLVVLASAEENPLHSPLHTAQQTSARQLRKLGGLILLAWLVLGSVLTYQLGVILAPAGFALALVLCLSLVHPAFAFSGFVAMILLRPWETFPNGLTLSLPRLSAALCFVSIAIFWVRNRRVELLWSKTTTLLVLFGLWALLSTTQANNPSDSRALFFDSVFKVSIIFVLCQNVIRQPWSYRVLIGTVGIAGLGLGVTALLYSFTFAGEAAEETGRLATIGMLSNANDIAAVMILAFPFAIAPLLKGSRNLLFWGMGVCALAVTAGTVWFTRSRGALLAFIVSFGVLFFLRSKRKSLVLIVVALLMVSFPILESQLGRDKSDLNQSSFSRLNYWKAGALMVIDHPFLGVGFEQYPKNYESYAPSLAFEWGERTAHSSWVLVLAETGIVGFILFFALTWSGFQNALRVRENHPEILLSFVGYFAAISFLSHSYLAFPYLIIAIAAAPSNFKTNEVLSL